MVRFCVWIQVETWRNLELGRQSLQNRPSSIHLLHTSLGFASLFPFFSCIYPSIFTKESLIIYFAIPIKKKKKKNMMVCLICSLNLIWTVCLWNQLKKSLQFHHLMELFLSGAMFVIFYIFSNFFMIKCFFISFV